MNNVIEHCLKECDGFFLGPPPLEIPLGHSSSQPTYVEEEKDSCARARFNGPPRAHSPPGRKKRARERIVPGTLTHMRATRNARGKDFFLSLYREHMLGTGE